MLSTSTIDGACWLPVRGPRMIEPNGRLMEPRIDLDLREAERDVGVVRATLPLGIALDLDGVASGKQPGLFERRLREKHAVHSDRASRRLATHVQHRGLIGAIVIRQREECDDRGRMHGRGGIARHHEPSALPRYSARFARSLRL